jgi:hypothetical protein
MQKKKNSSLGVIIVVLVVIAAVVGGAYYLTTVTGDKTDETAENEATDTTDTDDETKPAVTAEEAYDAAVTSLTESKSMQYTIQANNNMSLNVPDNPDQNMEQSMEMTGNGKEDIENNKFYSKQEETVDGALKVTEVIIIGDKVYTKEGEGEFKQEDKKGDELIVSEMLQKLAVEDYEVAGSEKVEGEDCFHYILKLDRDSLISFVENLGGGGEGGFDTEELTYEKFGVDFWVSKASEKIMKADIKLQGVETSIPEDPSGKATMEMNMDILLRLSDWGKAVEIKAPV